MSKTSIHFIGQPLSVGAHVQQLKASLAAVPYKDRNGTPFGVADCVMLADSSILDAGIVIEGDYSRSLGKIGVVFKNHQDYFLPYQVVLWKLKDAS
jgi:hypothetical protein